MSDGNFSGNFPLTFPHFKKLSDGCLPPGGNFVKISAHEIQV
jgi:hypothetical protein